jgi:peptide/nickel transport system substrate-binding protein
MTIQWRRAAGIGLVAALAIAACTPTPTSPGTSPTTGASATAAAVRRGAGDDLKILYWQAPTILNPHLATGTKDFDASRLVLEPLASWGPDGKPLANGLASEIPTIANGGVKADLTEVTWKLRTGVKWSDGTPFTADDVAFTFALTKDKTAATSTNGATTGVKSVVAKDANTVVITYDAPTPNSYQWGMAGQSLILQKAQFNAFIGPKLKDAPGNVKPIGTGPYKVVDFKSGDVVTYAMNENYRDPNKPYFKTVTFKGGGDAPSSARAVFQTGDVDYAWNLQVEASVLKPMADSSTRGQMLLAYGSSSERLVINFADPNPSLGDNRAEPTTKHPYFNGPDGKIVRQALAMATDRKTAATQIYGDAGKPGCNIVYGVADYESKNTAEFCNKFDVAGAAKLLDDNGWKLGTDNIRAKNGIKLNMVYQTTVNAVRQKVQDINKANWEKAGFKVELKAVPADVFFTNTSPDGANHFFADVEMYTNNSESTDFTTYLTDGWSTAQIAQKSNNWNAGNYGRYTNSEFDATLVELRKEADPAKRAALFIKANDILILDVVIIPLVARTQVTSGISKTLKNVIPTGWDSEMYQIADWAK